MSAPVLRGDRNQCPTCREYFNSSSSFDFHRVGRFGVDRRCRTVAEMLAAGMAKNSTGFWIEKPRLTPTFVRTGDVCASEGGSSHPSTEETRSSACASEVQP